MNANQLDALTRLRDQRKPLKIHPSTRKVLMEPGYVTGATNGYCSITQKGISFLGRWENRERIETTQKKVWREKGLAELHRHAMDWLEVHARLTHTARRYVSHVLDALLTESPIIPSGHRWKGGDEKCRAWAEVSLDAVRELRERQLEAHEHGADILVSYSIGPKVENRAGRRRAAAVERAAEDEVVSMERYLAERKAVG